MPPRKRKPSVIPAKPSELSIPAPHDEKARNKLIVFERRRKVAGMLLAERTYADIAKEMGTSRQQIRKDAVAIMKGWQADLDEIGGELMARETRKLSDYERILRKSFEAATASKKWTTAAQIYDRIHKCIELRSELFGLRGQKDVTGANVNQQFVIQASESEGQRQVSNGKTKPVSTAPQSMDTDRKTG